MNNYDRDIAEVEELNERNTSPVMVRRELEPVEEDNHALSPIQILRRKGPKASFDEEYNTRLGITFKFRNISPEKYKQINERTEKWIRYGGSLQQHQDGERANILMVIEGTIEPNLRDPEFLAAYNGDVEAAVRDTIRPGEIIRYSDKIMRLTGFTPDLREENAIANKVKNS